MSLDPRTVELPLDVRGLQSFETGRDVAGRLREHGADRAQRGQPEPRQPVAALAHRDLGNRGEIAGEHRRATHLRGRYAGRPRDRVGHDAFERALPKLAEEQADEETLLGLGRSREQRGELVAARSLGALTDDRLQARHRRVDLEQLERCAVGRGRLLAERRPPHADGSLRQLARQVGDRDSDLLGRRRTKALGDARDLREPRRRRGDVSRRRRYQREKHPRHSTRSEARARRRPRPRPCSPHVPYLRARERSHRRSQGRARPRLRCARHPRG